MFNRLSFSIRSHVFLGFTEERDLEAGIVDFEIDGRSVRERVKSPVPPEPPKFDPGKQFLGRLLSAVDRELEAYRSGLHSRPWPEQKNLLALTACEGCGHADCGGVWTEVQVAEDRVTWSKLFFSHGDKPGPVYDEGIFVFDRQAYNRLFSELHEAALADAQAGVR